MEKLFKTHVQITLESPVYIISNSEEEANMEVKKNVHEMIKEDSNFLSGMKKSIDTVSIEQMIIPQELSSSHRTLLEAGFGFEEIKEWSVEEAREEVHNLSRYF
ncbi:hypothetical protein DXY21_02947 [Bacillus velezensis]|uniref:hypothetical protein n=1 Tax=Bacillus velezensis TaxID=492670 RepID=UPI001363F67F|nr:hypothetical protein [Bacillus velezensis]QHM88873.1 hypothetical protein DXY21_02947 [Bacillus velezensis]